MKLFYFIYYCILVICGIALFFLIAWLIYDAYLAIRNKFLRYEESYKLVKVGRKEHKDAYTTHIPMTISAGKTRITTMTPVFHDEEYNVYLLYKGEDYIFNSEDMYQSLKVGDEVNVVVHEGYNLKGELKNIYLTIPE